MRPIKALDFVPALKQVKASVSQDDHDIYLKWNQLYGATSHKPQEGRALQSDEGVDTKKAVMGFGIAHLHLLKMIFCLLFEFKFHNRTSTSLVSLFFLLQRPSC